MEAGHVPEGVPRARVPVGAANAKRIEENREVARTLIQTATRVCAVEQRRTQSDDSSGIIRTIMKDMEGVVAPREKELKVMVFGTGKNGKSTMLNALLGENLLPSGSTTCTGNSTEIGGVTNAAGKEIVRLHRDGDPMDKWETHELAHGSHEESRIRAEWVTDMSIDLVKVEHNHEIFRHNVKILDVPGLNQDNERNAAVMVELERVDILLIVCSAQSATGSLTMEEKDQLARWKERMHEDQAFVVCNKMNAINASSAPLLRQEALELIVDNSKRFKSKRLMKMSREERLEQAEEDYEDSTDAELDDEARPYKKPDEGPIRRKVQEDVRGTVVRFTGPGPVGISVQKPGESRTTPIKKVTAETQAACFTPDGKRFPGLRPGMIIRQIGADDVPLLPAQDTISDDAKQAHADRVAEMLLTEERPLDIRLDGLFPKTPDDSIHFVSANEAVTAQLKQVSEPPAFQHMREVLFQRLKSDQERHLIEAPLDRTRIGVEGVAAFVEAALRPAALRLKKTEAEVVELTADLERVRTLVTTGFDEFLERIVADHGSSKLEILILEALSPGGDVYEFMQEERARRVDKYRDQIEDAFKAFVKKESRISEIRKKIVTKVVNKGQQRLVEHTQSLAARVCKDFSELILKQVSEITNQMEKIEAQLDAKIDVGEVRLANVQAIQWVDFAERIAWQGLITVLMGGGGAVGGGILGAAGGGILGAFGVGAGGIGGVAGAGAVAVIGAAGGALVLGGLGALAVAALVSAEGGTAEVIDIDARIEDNTREDLERAVAAMRVEINEKLLAPAMKRDLDHGLKESAKSVSVDLLVRQKQLGSMLKDLTETRENTAKMEAELKTLLGTLNILQRDSARIHTGYMESKGRQDELLKSEQDRKVKLFMDRCSVDGASARVHPEKAQWDLQQVLSTYMPPIPQSPVSERTFASSAFKAKYEAAEVPTNPLQMGALLQDLVKGYCRRNGIDWKRQGEPFLKALQDEAMANPQELLNQIPDAAQRMWTSTAQLQGREFCSMLNATVRDDDEEMIEVAAGLTKAMNELCVTATGDVSVTGLPRNSMGTRDCTRAATLEPEACDLEPEPEPEPEPAAVRPVPRPPGDQCYRGGGFQNKYRDFFVTNRQFRQPAFLPTSFSKDTANEFITRSRDESKVLWIIRTPPPREDGSAGCVHVNMVTKRVPGLPDEQEFLFAPYSVFTVERAEWNAGTVEKPHVIELKAAADNKAEPEDLPLAPWS